MIQILTPALTETIHSAFLFGIAAISAWTAWQTSQVRKTGLATHALSNSNMAAQLKLNVEFATALSVSLHRTADLSKQDGDAAAATAMDLVVKAQNDIYQKHLIAQALVDASGS